MLKIILSNTAAQLTAKVIAVSVTFVTTVMIIRLGGPALYGDLTKALSLIAIGVTAIDFGLNASAVRSMGVGHQKATMELQRVISARLYLSLAAILITNLCVYLLPGGYTPAIKSVYWLGSLAIIFQGLFTSYNTWFQSRLSYWRSSLATSAGALVGALLTYLTIRYSPTLGNLLISSTLGFGVMAGVSYLYAPRVNYVKGLLDVTSVVRTLSRSLTLGAILVMSILASKLDVVIMGIFRSSSEVGQYGFAYRIFDVALVLPVFVMNAIFPLLVKSNNAQKSALIKGSSLYLFLTGLAGAAVVYWMAPYISLVRPGMDLSIHSLQILVLALPVFYLTAPLMWQLIEAHLEKYLLFVYGSAAVINGLLNYFVIPVFGPLAAAVVTGITETYILLWLLYIRRVHS